MRKYGKSPAMQFLPVVRAANEEIFKNTIAFLVERGVAQIINGAYVPVVSVEGFLNEGQLNAK